MTLLFNQHRDIYKRKKLRHQRPDTEKILWSLLKGHQLNGYKFRRQYGVGRYVLDFYCPQTKLGIEIDGDYHFTAEAQIYDRLREAYLHSLGIQIIRFTNREIREELTDVVQTIYQALSFD